MSSTDAINAFLITPESLPLPVAVFHLSINKEKSLVFYVRNGNGNRILHSNTFTIFYNIDRTPMKICFCRTRQAIRGDSDGCNPLTPKIRFIVKNKKKPLKQFSLFNRHTYKKCFTVTTGNSEKCVVILDVCVKDDCPCEIFRQSIFFFHSVFSIC